MLFLVLALANSTGLYAAAQILSVSSFRECLSLPDSSGNGTSLDCGTSSFATVVEMRLQTGQDGDNVETFEAEITVVPNQNSDEQQTGSGVDCPAPDDTTCQTVTPGMIRATAGAATHAYRLTEEPSLSATGIPYEHYFNQKTHIIDTNDAGQPNLNTLLAMNPAPMCSYVSRTVTEGATPIGLDSDEGSMDAVFESSDANFDHIGCGMNARAPQNLRATTASGAITYTMACNHLCTDSSSTHCTTYIEVSANFQRVGPFCRFFSVADKPDVAVEVTIELLGLDQPLINETISLSTIASNLSGATSISTPQGTMAATILGTFSADGLEGASLPGYLVTCTSDGRILDLGGDSLSDNPFDDLPSSETDTCDFNDGTPSRAYPGPSIATEPCALAHLTGGDPYAMYAFVNVSMGVTQGTQCGMSAVELDIYSKPPLAMQTLTPSSPAIAIQDLVARTDGGTGAYPGLVFCVPGHGLEFQDKGTPSPCDMIDAMVQYELDEAAASTAPGYIRGGVLAPYAPFVYTPTRPNAYPARDPNGGAYSYVVKPRKAASLDLVLTLAGGAIGIRDGVPNASLDPAVTYCAVGAGRVGTAVYKVCNDAASPRPANYNLLVQCGLESNYNQRTKQFTVPSGALVEPASRLLSDVPPGECRSIDDGGLFVVQIAALNTTDSDAVLCAYTVQSADTATPSNVVLARDVVQCLRSDVYSNGTAVTPGSGIYAPTDYLDNNVTMAINEALANAEAEIEYLQEQEDEADTQRIAIGVSIIGMVLLGLTCVVCVIGCSCYNTYISRKVEKTVNGPPGSGG